MNSLDIYVDEIKHEDNVLKCNANKDIKGLTAAARMIVDSDNMEFVYLLDDGDSFQRLHFVRETWSMLKDFHGSEPVVNGEIRLAEFWEELDFLLDNIVDNKNYGQAFEGAIREEFEL